MRRRVEGRVVRRCCKTVTGDLAMAAAEEHASEVFRVMVAVDELCIMYACGCL